MLITAIAASSHADQGRERGEKFAVNEERVLTLLCPVHSSGSGEHPAFFRYTIARAAAFLFPVVDRPSVPSPNSVVKCGVL